MPKKLKSEQTYNSSMNLDSLLAEILISANSNELRVRQAYRLGKSKFRLGNLCLPSVGSWKG